MKEPWATKVEFGGFYLPDKLGSGRLHSLPRSRRVYHTWFPATTGCQQGSITFALQYRPWHWGEPADSKLQALLILQEVLKKCPNCRSLLG